MEFQPQLTIPKLKSDLKLRFQNFTNAVTYIILQFYNTGPLSVMLP